jgi:hypothetical protein
MYRLGILYSLVVSTCGRSGPRRLRQSPFLGARGLMLVLLAIPVLSTILGQISVADAYTCNNREYVNSSGHVIHSPSCGRESPRHTATCRDGSISYSEHNRGTCSSHGGVADWG